MKDRRDRELSFSEWQRLSHRHKREIMVQRWNPGEPSGEETRAAILEGFGAANPQLLEKAIAATAFFGRVGWSIAVVVQDRSVRVPRRFDEFPVVKGLLRDLRHTWNKVEWLRR